MEAAITVVRAVGTEFIRRTLRPFAVAGLLVVAVLLFIGAWLTTISAWWWLLEILLIGTGVAAILLAVLLRTILQRIESPLTAQQRHSVVSFVDKLQRSMETIQTPYPMILFYIVRDTVRPRPEAFIATIAQDSRTLGPDFAALRQELSQP